MIAFPEPNGFSFGSTSPGKTESSFSFFFSSSYETEIFLSLFNFNNDGFFLFRFFFFFREDFGSSSSCLSRILFVVSTFLFFSPPPPTQFGHLRPRIVFASGDMQYEWPHALHFHQYGCIDAVEMIAGKILEGFLSKSHSAAANGAETERRDANPCCRAWKNSIFLQEANWTFVDACRDWQTRRQRGEKDVHVEVDAVEEEDNFELKIMI
jgi:hypothetical protein